MQSKIINNIEFDKNIKDRISEIDRIFNKESKERIKRGDIDKFNKIAHASVVYLNNCKAQ